MILRTRDPLEQIWAAAFWDNRLIYYPPGFFASSWSDDAVYFYQQWRWPRPLIFHAEKLLLERADAVVHFLSDEAITWFLNKGVKVKGPAKVVYAACMPELSPNRHLEKLSRRDGEFHLVHATGVARPGSSPTLAGYADHRKKWARIVQQGIHVHAYFSHIDTGDKQWAHYHQLARRSPYFHIERQLEFDDLLVAMTQYDYALKHWDLSRLAVYPEFKNYLTTNFFAYLQAGLPCIVSPTMNAETRLVQQYGIGVVVEENEIPQLRQMLDTQDNHKLTQRVREAVGSSFQYDHRTLGELVFGK